MNIKTSLAVTASLALLTACGGDGGSDPGPVPPTTAEGIWNGTTSTSRSTIGIILGNSAYWILYSAPNNSMTIAGIIVGKGTSDNGKFTSTQGIDFNLEGQGIHQATLSANYVAKDSFNGTISYPTQNITTTLTSSYNAAFDHPLSLSAIAGTYSGNAVVVGAYETATLAITSTGEVSGSASTGCQFTGNATPFASGTIYDLSITFGGGVCSNGTNTVTGIIYLDTNAKKLYAAGINNSMSNGFIFVGATP